MSACCGNSKSPQAMLVSTLKFLHCGGSNSRSLPPNACMYRYRTLSACKMGCSNLLYVLKNHGYCSLTNFRLSSSVQSLQRSG